METKQITRALVNPTFAQISDHFGYTASEYVTEIATLLSKWKSEGMVEVYQTPQDKKYGRIKSSEMNNSGVISPYYIGLYHARLVDSENDPLVVVKFYEDDVVHHTQDATEAVDMRFMIHHDDYFGTQKVKKSHAALRAMWEVIQGKIEEGD